MENLYAKSLIIKILESNTAGVSQDHIEKIVGWAGNAQASYDLLALVMVDELGVGWSDEAGDVIFWVKE